MNLDYMKISQYNWNTKYELIKLNQKVMLVLCKYENKSCNIFKYTNIIDAFVALLL